MSAPTTSARFMTPVELDGRLTRAQKHAASLYVRQQSQQRRRRTATPASTRTHRLRTRRDRFTDSVRGRPVEGVAAMSGETWTEYAALHEGGAA